MSYRSRAQHHHHHLIPLPARCCRFVADPLPSALVHLVSREKKKEEERMMSRRMMSKRTKDGDYELWNHRGGMMGRSERDDDGDDEDEETW